MELLMTFWRDVCEVPPIVLYIFFGGGCLIAFFAILAIGGGLSQKNNKEGRK